MSESELTQIRKEILEWFGAFLALMGSVPVVVSFISHLREATLSLDEAIFAFFYLAVTTGWLFQVRNNDIRRSKI